MDSYTLIVVLNENMDKVLMCQRKKEPYKGLYNFLGGKIETDESNLESAYRELLEETGINRSDITLKPLMSIEYYFSGTTLNIFFGRASKLVNAITEINPLIWTSINTDMYHSEYAGEGILGHIIQQVKIHKSCLLRKD